METLNQKAEQLTRKNVIYCVSHLVDSIGQDMDFEGVMEFAKFDEEIDDVEMPLEYWIVSDWLADKLIKKGESVQKDFYGLTVWGRFTSGQSISIDYVIQQIAKELWDIEEVA